MLISAPEYRLTLAKQGNLMSKEEVFNALIAQL